MCPNAGPNKEGKGLNLKRAAEPSHPMSGETRKIYMVLDPEGGLSRVPK